MKQINSIIVSCFAIICVALFGSVFTSCSNDDDLLLAGDSQTEQVSSFAQDSLSAVTRGTMTTWYSVSTTIKNRYYSGFNYATNGSPSNAYNNPNHVGFYTALNATYNTSYGYSSTLNYLNTLCSSNSGLTHYEGYSGTGTTDYNNFINHILYFLYYKAKPVVVLANTANASPDILIVWAASTDGVRVTRITDSPTTLFGDNYIIELSWSNFFSKGLAASNSNTVNVAYMDSSIYG